MIEVSRQRLLPWVVSGLGLLMVPSVVWGAELHVSASTGKNNNDGSKDKPFKNIDKAVKKAKPGDTIKVAEGVYSGTFGVGFVESKVAFKFLGGYAKDFSSRDPTKHLTVFQPDNASGAKARNALWKWPSGSKVGGLVIDGFVFDMGERNSYDASKGKPDGVASGMLTLPPGKGVGVAATVEQPCVAIQSGSKVEGKEVRIENNVFLNCANFAIQAVLDKGSYFIRNNVIINSRMAGIELSGTCGNLGPNKPRNCGPAEISNNTVLFTWSRQKDFLDMGYGIRIMKGVEYNIHHNIIGTAILTGVDHSRFNTNEWVKMDNNVFFGNRKGDLHFCPASNADLWLPVDQFGDLEFASVADNRSEIPKGLPVNKAYLEAFLAARYSEKTDYDPNSAANQMRERFGLNKQGKINSKVSMFGNHYPLEGVPAFFGAVAGVGAQKPAN